MHVSDTITTATILESIADGVFTIDLDYRITSINRAATKILGIIRGNAIGKKCFEVFHANICEHSCLLKETIETGKNIIARTIYIVNAEGDKIPISISTALLKDENSHIIGGVETFQDISALEQLRKTIELGYSYEDIISKNKHMQDIFAILPDIAESDANVLIEGPSGTGKELIAHAVHNLSGRKEQPFVVINCTALPDTLLESELFGYKAGAFTDAKKDKPGKIALARGGTVFLDEIGDITPAFQVKLLRFIQHKEYEPLGSTKTEQADVRIITATNKHLYTEVHKGGFRDDLYYRLNIVTITLPSLNKRKEDIPLLVKHFIKRFNVLKNKYIEGVTDDVMNILMNYDYKGNIRELENIIEHAFVLCKESFINRTHLPRNFFKNELPVNEEFSLAEMERYYIVTLLEKYGGNRNHTAKALGIDQSTLWRKLKKYGLSSLHE